MEDVITVVREHTAVAHACPHALARLAGERVRIDRHILDPQVPYPPSEDYE